MKKWLNKIFNGRYGADQLSLVLLVFSLLLNLLGSIFKLKVLSYLSFVPLIFSIMRSLSKDIDKRRLENYKFSILISPIYKRWHNLKRKFKERKTHKFFKCPSCKTDIRVPKNKGRINITCPKCNTKFEKRT